MTGTSPRKFLVRFSSCENGNVLLEFGFIATVLLGALVGVVEFMAVMSQTTKVTNAARAAVQHAMRDPDDVTGITSVAAKSGGLDSASLTVTVDQFCECPGVGSVPCGDTCAGGETNYGYVTVNVSQPAMSYIHGNGLLGGVVIDRSATMRTR